MSKHRERKVTPVEDLDSFRRGDGLVFVPYYHNGRWADLSMTPEIMRKGMTYATLMFCDDATNVFPLLGRAIQSGRKVLRGH